MSDPRSDLAAFAPRRAPRAARDQIRILIWQWGRRGGGPRFGVDLAHALARRRDTNVLLSLSRHAEVIERLDVAARGALHLVDTYRGAPSAIRKFITLPATAREARAILDDFRPDVAVCAMPALLDVAMVQALEQRKVPFVAIVHDADLHPGDGLWPQMMLQDRMARSAHGLVALSDHVARALRRRYGPDKPLEVMYHAPFTFDRPSVGPARFPRQREGRLLFFGRLLPYKGLDLLAEAMVLLQDRMRIELAIHGAGAIERRVRARLARIRHLTLEEGWIAEERIPDLILAADAVVAPYREASQSGVVPIAYAYGRPVVATPVGGLAEQVVHGETGLVAASVTPGALAAAIERLFTDEGLYTHCAETAVRHAAQRLTWQNFASTLYRFCGSVAPAADVAA